MLKTIKPMKHYRITYTTPKGNTLSNRTIEAPTRAEAENEFKKDFPKMVISTTP